LLKWKKIMLRKKLMLLSSVREYLEWQLLMILPEKDTKFWYYKQMIILGED
jgi:hypothetical protein